MKLENDSVPLDCGAAFHIWHGICLSMEQSEVEGLRPSFSSHVRFGEHGAHPSDSLVDSG